MREKTSAKVLEGHVATHCESKRKVWLVVFDTQVRQPVEEKQD